MIRKDIQLIAICVATAAAVAAYLFWASNGAREAVRKTPFHHEAKRIPGWLSISILGVCTFQIPPTMELQGGAYKKINDQFRQEFLQIEPSHDRVVAQPKGLNAFDRNALKLYSRVIVETQRGKPGDYTALDESLVLSKNDLWKINQGMRDMVQKATTLETTKGMKLELLSWEPPHVVQVNGVDMLFYSYTRMGDLSSVLVRTYIVQNNDCMHTITVSYRQTETNLWANDLDNVIETFQFTKR